MKTIFDKYMENKEFIMKYNKVSNELTKEELIQKGLQEAKECKSISVGKGKTYETIDEMLADMKKKWNILGYLESYWYRYFWNFVSEIPLRVRTFIQRGKKGWAISDTWSFDYYLAKVITEGCQHLKNNSCHEFHEQKNFDTIIQTFKTATDILEYKKHYISSEEFTWAKYKKAIRFHKKFDKKYNQNCHVMNLREVRLFEKGFGLFENNFFRLWD